jgi:hypothetical protein
MNIFVILIGIEISKIEHPEPVLCGIFVCGQGLTENLN